MTSKSAAKLIPSDPSRVMVFRDIYPNLVTLSTPFNRHGVWKVGGRATIVKLQTGSIAVFSPVALTDDVRAKVQSMGNNVKYISAMDIEHHIFVSPWAKAYPEAEVIGMEGLPEKRELDPDTAGIRFAHVFTKGNKRDLRISEEFDHEFDYEYVDGHGNKELVYFHKPTKTLIEADFFFNLPANEQYSKTGQPANSGIITKLLNSLTGTQGEALAQRRLIWYAFAKDRGSYAQSVHRMKAWDIQRIIPSHGDVVEDGAKSVFDKLTLWFQEGFAQK
jgi:Domain of unknown function (DUF4336)